MMTNQPYSSQLGDPDAIFVDTSKIETDLDSYSAISETEYEENRELYEDLVKKWLEHREQEELSEGNIEDLLRLEKTAREGKILEGYLEELAEKAAKARIRWYSKKLEECGFDFALSEGESYLSEENNEILEKLRSRVQDEGR